MAGLKRENFNYFSDEHLMSAISQGDKGAFNELYTRYNRRLLYYFYRMLGNSSERAKDFLQDIFIKIIEKPELFDASRKFSTWVFSVAHNMCKNEYRRLTVRKKSMCNEDPGRLEEMCPQGLSEERLTADQIFAEISRMGGTEKTAFLLFYREDFSLQEISQVLNLPEGTVKSKLFYTRRKICQKLKIKDKL